MKSFKEKLREDRECADALRIMEENDISLFETIYRPGSDAYFSLLRNVKRMCLLQNGDGLMTEATMAVSDSEQEFLMTDIGEFGLYDGNDVPLDFPFISEEKDDDDDDVELNKPKRGGPKKFYVYVRDPKTKNVKKVTFGDTSGLKVKYNNKDARDSFVARHNCAEKKDKTKAGYWSCRLPRYWKALGLEKPESDFRFW